ncbi:MAG TPA: hypothetical protein VIO64_19675 [Pseudobacteroides sp.]|uniref:hypothetical protein n=1 Tax=Pseudobacteroides sp. TaxID=1968840 RepID=UPI002F94F7B4
MLLRETSKIITLTLAVGILIVTLAGCGNKEPSKTQNTNTSASAITPTPNPTRIKTSSTEIIVDSPAESTITYIDDNFLSPQDTQIEFDSNDFNVYAAKNKKEIKMGITRKGLEQILGKPLKNEYNEEFLNYNGLKVYFRNNKVAAFYIEKFTKNSNQYYTKRFIGLKDGIEDIKKAYGQGIEIKSGDDKFLTYYAKRENNKMVSLDVQEYRKKPASAKDTDVFVLTFLINEMNEVTFVLISDYRFEQSSQ